MKKIIILSTLLALSAASFSQPTESSPIRDREYYQLKSQTQKISGFICLGITAIALPIACSGNSSISTSASLAIIGVLSGLTTVTLFIASARNKRKARNATASFDIKTSPQILSRSFVYKSYPALSLKIRL